MPTPPVSPPRPLPWRGATVVGAIVGPAIVVAMMHPVIRGAGFHTYADQRTTFGIPHFGDVLSNLPFVIIGIAGLFAARDVTGLPRGLVALLFGSVLAIGLGSGAYHLVPNDATLVFDWMPIGVTAALMVALLVHDRIDPKMGWTAAAILPAAAIVSVALWWLGGGTGPDGGDTRWYGLIQLTSIALVPVIVMLYPRGRLDRGWLLAGVACFVLARLIHMRDHQLLDASGVISGHAVKHLFAAAATWCVLLALPRGSSGRDPETGGRRPETGDWNQEIPDV